VKSRTRILPIVVSVVLCLSIFSQFQYSPRCPEKVSRLSFSGRPHVIHQKLALSLVPGTLQWTKVKALPESAWAKQLPRSVKGKTGSQTTAQPNGRSIESNLAPQKRLNQALTCLLSQTSGDAPHHLETMASDRLSSQTKAELIPNPPELYLPILSLMAMAKGRRERRTRRPPIWTNS